MVRSERVWIMEEELASKEKHCVWTLSEFTSLERLVEVLKKHVACGLKHRDPEHMKTARAMLWLTGFPAHCTFLPTARFSPAEISSTMPSGP